MIFVDLLDTHFNMLGGQVLDELCRAGVKSADGFRKYKPLELTLTLIGTHASSIWELNRVITASRPARASLARTAAAAYTTVTPVVLPSAPPASSDGCPRCNPVPDPDCWVHNPNHPRIPFNWRPATPEMRLLYAANCKKIGKRPYAPAVPNRNAGNASSSYSQDRNGRGGERGNRNGGGFDNQRGDFNRGGYDRQRGSDSYRGGDVRQQGNNNRPYDSGRGGGAYRRNEARPSQQQQGRQLHDCCIRCHRPAKSSLPGTAKDRRA